MGSPSLGVELAYASYPSPYINHFSHPDLGIKGAGKALGTIVNVAKAQLVDGETVAITDASDTTVIFEFDVAGDGVSGTNTQVDVSGVTTATEVATVFRTAIEASALEVVILQQAGHVLNLMNLGRGEGIGIQENVVDAGFVVSGFTGNWGADGDDLVALRFGKCRAAGLAMNEIT